MIKEIKSGNKTLALIFFKEKADGIKFLTPQSYPLQVGLIENNRGKKIVKAHRHKDLEYDVKTTQEFICVERGSVWVAIYDDDFNEAGTFNLTAGDFMLSVSGGHAFIIEKGSRLIEVKQGPYPGDKEAKIYAEDFFSH